MKHRSFLLLMTTLFATSFLCAQKNVNVDNSRFTYIERETPKKPQNPMFFYYGVNLNMTSSTEKIVDRQTLIDNLKIEGQRKTDNPEEGDIMVNIQMGTLSITKADMNTRVVENKDKEGKVTSRDHYYSIVASYNFECNANVTKGATEIDKYVVFRRTSNYTYTTDEFTSSGKASEFWKNNKDLIHEQLTREYANKAISSLNSSLSQNLGFPLIKETDIIKTINEKKHPENDALRAMSDALKAKLETLDGTNPLKEEDLTDIIEYFKNIPVRYTDPKLKADVRLRYVAYYNLCKIYLYLDQPDNVKPYADLILENGHDKKDSERMTKAADKLKERLQKSEFKTRHFNPDAYFQD